MKLWQLPLPLLALISAQVSANPLHHFRAALTRSSQANELTLKGASCSVEALPASCESMDEPTRMSTAARLTLCDLAAGGLSIPYECRTDRIQACVEALARSPQHWSSYSGYLRDLLGVCQALNEQRHVHLARSLYTNASQAMLDLLHVLQRNEGVRLEREQQGLVKQEEVVTGLQDAEMALSRGLKVRNLIRSFV